MRTYSSVRALCGSNYTCFTDTRVLGQFGEIGSEYPNSYAGTNEKYPSLQILVSHQMRPYSSVRALCGFSYTCLTGIGTIWENWARIPQITCRDTWKVIQSLQILILHQMRPYSSVKGLLWGDLYLFHRYSGIGAIWGNLAQISQIMHRDTWKVIQSLQLHISHQISFYSSV